LPEFLNQAALKGNSIRQEFRARADEGAAGTLFESMRDPAD
jgi:hypothetical protein